MNRIPKDKSLMKIISCKRKMSCGVNVGTAGPAHCAPLPSPGYTSLVYPPPLLTTPRPDRNNLSQPLRSSWQSSGFRRVGLGWGGLWGVRVLSPGNLESWEVFLCVLFLPSLFIPDPHLPLTSSPPSSGENPLGNKEIWESRERMGVRCKVELMVKLGVAFRARCTPSLA